MTKEQYKKECTLLPDSNYCAFAPLPRWCDIADKYIESLETDLLLMQEKCEKLQDDNRSLVEQMNAMANRYESLEQHCTALEEDINMWKVSGHTCRRGWNE